MTDDLQPLPTVLIRLSGSEQMALRHAARMADNLATDSPEWWADDAADLAAIIERIDRSLGRTLARPRQDP